MAKADRTTIRHRLNELTRLILAGAEFSDLRQYVADQGWEVSDRQLRRYLDRVYAELAEGARHDRASLLGRHLMQRRTIYAKAIKGSDLRTALAVLKDEA